MWLRGSHGGELAGSSRCVRTRSGGASVKGRPARLNGRPLTSRPPPTSPCGSCVRWWCCSPCCSCWGFPKTSTDPAATAVPPGRTKLSGASGPLKVPDSGKVSRHGGTPSGDETNARPSSSVSTDTAARWKSSWVFIHGSGLGQENLSSACSYEMLLIHPFLWHSWLCAPTSHELSSRQHSSGNLSFVLLLLV